MSKPKLRKSAWLQKNISWKRFIKTLKPQVKFNQPARPEQLEAAEQKLGVTLSADLYNVLLETNGIEDWLLPIEKIVDVNQEYRTDPMYKVCYTPLDGLLFFLHDGTGSHFAYPICGGKCDGRPEIIYWLHENDERSFSGNTLADVIRRYLGVPMNSVKWPKLAKIDHVAGRLARESDVRNGRAVFFLNQAGRARPISMPIPQYGFKVDYNSGEHVPVILVQAEEMGGVSYFGVRFVGKKLVAICTRNELHLRGTEVVE